MRHRRRRHGTVPASVYCPGVAEARMRGIAVVTGASSGIGAATARALAGDGWRVVMGARRAERIEVLASEIGARSHPLDVDDTGSVERFVAFVSAADEDEGSAVGQSRLLVNNAGGAFGWAPVADADERQWRAMYETNVLGAVRMTRALLPLIEAHGDGTIVTVGSIAGHEAYPNGAGYNAAKFAVRAVMSALRQELLGRPVRVCEVDPGMVETEFSLVRFGGDAERAAAVYEGVTPLTAGDVAECIRWIAARPPHVNVDQLVVLARDQAGARQVHRHSGEAH